MTEREGCTNLGSQLSTQLALPKLTFAIKLSLYKDSNLNLENIPSRYANCSKNYLLFSIIGMSYNQNIESLVLF